MYSVRIFLRCYPLPVEREKLSLYMSCRVPTEFETERLQLRQFRNDDWRGLHAFYSEASATAYTIGRALSEGET